MQEKEKTKQAREQYSLVMSSYLSTKNINWEFKRSIKELRSQISTNFPLGCFEKPSPKNKYIFLNSQHHLLKTAIETKVQVLLF